MKAEQVTHVSAYIRILIPALTFKSNEKSATAKFAKKASQKTLILRMHKQLTSMKSVLSFIKMKNLNDFEG